MKFCVLNGKIEIHTLRRNLASVPPGAMPVSTGSPLEIEMKHILSHIKSITTELNTCIVSKTFLIATQKGFELSTLVSGSFGDRAM